MDTSLHGLVDECLPQLHAVNPSGEHRLTISADFSVGEWLVEPCLCRLSRQGSVVHLRPQLMDLLVCLASGNGRTVMKETIYDTVWSRRFVTESSLPRAVADLRHALGDDARQPRIIETINKRGYRIIVPIARRGTGPAVSRWTAIPAATKLSPVFLGLIVGVFVVAGVALLLVI